MKSIKKILFIMVALATALAFVSCSSEDDDPSTVAVYKGTTGGVTVTITFLDDNTWTAEVPDYPEGNMSGTYTGDPSKDGKITIKGTMEGEEFEDEIEIANGKTDYFGGTFTRQ